MQALAAAEIRNQLAQDEHSTSLVDYRMLMKQEKVKFPRDAMDVVISLGRYAVMCQTLFQETGLENPHSGRLIGIACESHHACGIWPPTWHFWAIADTLHARPTRIREELVPTEPSYIGACDACRHGMGGVWFSADESECCVWLHQIAKRVRQALVTFEHPQGSLSISDLELAALIAHKDGVAQHWHVGKHTLWVVTDNQVALSWSDKGSAIATSARAYLLRLNSLHQRRHRYVAQQNHIAGRANIMADDASRLWHLTDSKILTHGGPGVCRVGVPGPSPKRPWQSGFPFGLPLSGVGQCWPYSLTGQAAP